MFYEVLVHYEEYKSMYSQMKMRTLKYRLLFQCTSAYISRISQNISDSVMSLFFSPFIPRLKYN